MKLKLFLLLAIHFYFMMVLFSCSRPLVNQPNAYIANHTSLSGKRIQFNEYPCSVAKSNAKNDIENGKLYYFDIIYFEGQRSNIELTKLLEPYKIELYEVYGIDVDPQLHNCFEKLMNDAIKSKHGANFIDSLRNIAELNYVKNHPNKIYTYEECDTTSRYQLEHSYSNYREAYKKDFFNDFQYPDKYINKNEKFYSYTSAEIIIHKNGLTEIIHIETKFQNTKNNVHKELFDKRVEKFINESIWVPAKSAGITVSSRMSITIHYN